MLSVLRFQTLRFVSHFNPFRGSSVAITHNEIATTAEPEKNESRDHHPWQAMSTFLL